MVDWDGTTFTGGSYSGSTEDDRDSGGGSDDDDDRDYDGTTYTGDDYEGPTDDSRDSDGGSSDDSGGGGTDDSGSDSTAGGGTSSNPAPGLGGGGGVSTPDPPAVDNDNPFDDGGSSGGGSSGGGSSGSDGGSDDSPPVGNTPDSGNLPSQDGSSSDDTSRPGRQDERPRIDDDDDPPVGNTPDSGNLPSQDGSGNDDPPVGNTPDSGNLPGGQRDEDTGRDPENIDDGAAPQDQTPEQGIEEDGSPAEQQTAQQVEEQFLGQLEEETGRDFDAEDVRVESEQQDGQTVAVPELTKSGEEQIQYEQNQRELDVTRDAISQIDQQTEADLTAGDDITVQDGQVTLTDQGRLEEAAAQLDDVGVDDLDIVGDQVVRDTGDTDVSPGTPGTGQDTARSQVVEQLEDRTGTDLSREDVAFQETDDGVQGQLSDQGEITVARENAPFADVPGVGTVTQAGAVANEQIKDATDPAAEGFDEVTPDQQDAIDVVESAVDTGASTDVPFTDTDFGDVDDAVANSDPAQAVTGTDVPFTDTDFDDAGQFAETAGNTDVPFTETDINDADDLATQAVDSATDAARNAPETAAGTDVPFTDTDFADAGELPNRVGQSATDAAVEASVPVRQEVYGVTEEQARENIREDISQAGDGTYDAFSPAVGRNPAGGLNAARGIAGIAGIAGGAAAVNELDVGESTQDQDELQPGDPTASQGELEATERATTELEVGQGLTSSEIDVQVGQQQTDPSQLQLAQQIVIGEEVEEQREITEEDRVQDRPGRIGRGINRGPRINEERQGGVSELYDPQRPTVEDDGSDIFERTFPTGGSAVVGESTADPIEELEEQVDQSQRSEVEQGTDTIVGSGQVQDPIVGQQPDQAIDEQADQIQDGIQDQVQDQLPDQTPDQVQDQTQFPEPTESIFETGAGAGFGAPAETVSLEEQLQVQEPVPANPNQPFTGRRLPRLSLNSDEEELEDIEEEVESGTFDTGFATSEDLLNG